MFISQFIPQKATGCSMTRLLFLFAQAKAINQKTVFFTKQKDESIIFSILVGMLIVFLLAILGLLWKYYQLKNKKRVNQE